MKCKNCGANISDKAKRCPNCGTFCSTEGYILLTDDDALTEYYDDGTPTKKKKKFATAIIILLIIALAVGGVYYYLNIYSKVDNTPQLSFSTGCGIINGDEQVVYVTLPENSKIEYIHGVALYDYNKMADDKSEKSAVTTDYEYTKSVDGVFRTIFFNTDDLKLDDDKNYTYTFEINVSFAGSSNIYTYTQSVNFNSSDNSDVADIVFDHSLTK